MKAQKTTTDSTDLLTEPFIDKQEVAQRLRRTVRAVNNMIGRGLLPYYRFDSRMSFRWSEIQAVFAKTCRVPAKAELANEATDTQVTTTRGVCR